MPYRSHSPYIDDSSINLQKADDILFLVMQFSSPPSIHPSAIQMSSNATLRLVSSLNIRVQVSHTYGTTGKLMVLHIPIFTF
jgi:hypothetical protein